MTTIRNSAQPKVGLNYNTKNRPNNINFGNYEKFLKSDALTLQTILDTSGRDVIRNKNEAKEIFIREIAAGLLNPKQIFNNPHIKRAKNFLSKTNKT